MIEIRVQVKEGFQPERLAQVRILKKWTKTKTAQGDVKHANKRNLTPVAQEESNSLTNEVALERAWFSVGQGAMAQTYMLERFENLLADYDSLSETHAECSEMGLEGRTCQIQSLEVELAKKDYALTYTERLLAEGVKDCDKLTVLLGQAEVEKFDSIQKLLLTVGRGLSEGRTNKEILDLLHKAKDFDLSSDKKLYPMYDKLFETEYPYVKKIASGYRHSVAELLKVYLEPDPDKGTSAPTISKALDGSSAALPKGN
ncbi:hypothetical protein Tco_0736860 [Tanacetum coccineum]